MISTSIEQGGEEQSSPPTSLSTNKLETKAKPYVPNIFLEIAESTGAKPHEVARILNFLLPNSPNLQEPSSQRVENMMDFLQRNNIAEETFFTLCQHESFSSALYRFAYFKYILPNIPKIMLGICEKTMTSSDPKDAKAIYQLVQEFIPELRRSAQNIEEHRHLHLSSMNSKQLLNEVDRMTRKVVELREKISPIQENETS